MNCPAPAAAAPEQSKRLIPPALAWALILGLAAGIAEWKPGQHSPGVNPEGWRLLAVFLPCILGLMLAPIPGGAIVLFAVVASVAIGALTLPVALQGYSEASVWMVLAAYFLARAFIKTGLARRIALQFVRLLGRSTLGLGYALVATDALLAAMIPSVAARVGGVTLPIARSLAELYQSFPGESATRIGRYLMQTLYQGGVMACALFFTGQASNPLAAQQARELTAHAPGGPVVLGYGTWFLHASVPALLSLLVIPWLTFRWERPVVTHTPEAASFAREQLAALGAPRWPEWVLAAVFAGVVGCWVAFGGHPQHGSSYMTVIALAGVAVLLLARVLTWEDLVNERGAWDVFIWYGGLVQLGRQLKETGLLSLFAQTVTGGFGAWHWLLVFVLTLLIYFYAHYAFASITTHIVSMYPAFVVVSLAAGAPPALVVCAFAFFANFSAGLTHYGTTPGPIVFATGYVPQWNWWRLGGRLSLVNGAIWLTAGLAWWKLTGLW
jgi:DASS family divalent anion:Na+ symporter